MASSVISTSSSSHLKLQTNIVGTHKTNNRKTSQTWLTVKLQTKIVGTNKTNNKITSQTWLTGFAWVLSLHKVMLIWWGADQEDQEEYHEDFCS